MTTDCTDKICLLWRKAHPDVERLADLLDHDRLGHECLVALTEAGLKDVEEIRRRSTEELGSIPLVGKALLARIEQRVLGTDPAVVAPGAAFADRDLWVCQWCGKTLSQREKRYYGKRAECVDYRACSARQTADRGRKVEIRVVSFTNRCPYPPDADLPDGTPNFVLAVEAELRADLREFLDDWYARKGLEILTEAPRVQ
ncbi:hypothetical protein ACFVGM_09105 [Kitasatospora purpeofusca]|uniref:hypothetical protein n=1 Tax=Kitasatospora purpeofusca TaxID=67352 RepID=UPI0036B3F1CC